MALRPARLEPQFVPRLWGTRNLAPLFPEKTSLRDPVGEVWLTGNDCRFADGPFAGERLGDAWVRMSDDWAGVRSQRDKPFPVLAKFLFPADKLSVQVHPDDDYAVQHEPGKVGKTEMWYVVSAQPGAEVRVGLRPHVNAEQFRSAIADNTAEDLLDRVPVNSGDTIFVPAGTVHTIGPGMILCEIQQNSDITYRVFDFNRRDAGGKLRELHTKKALDVIRFGAQLGGKLTPSQRQNERTQPCVLVECPYFTVIRHAFTTTQHSAKLNGKLELMIVLDGSGILHTQPGDENVEYSRAQAWLMPAALRDCVYEPKEATTLLRISVPDV